MDSAEEQAANSLLRSGLATDSKTSRRIVKEVMRSILDDAADPILVHGGDLLILDDLAHDINCAIWEMDGIADDHRPKLLELAERSKHILRVVRRYITPESAKEPL